MARLSYRFVTIEDKEDYRDFLFDSTVTEPAGYKAAIDEDSFDFIFNNMLNNRVISVIYLGKIIGYVSLYPETIDDLPLAKCAGIGFLLNKKYHRQGFGKEMLEYFTTLLKEKFDYVYCDAFIENEASNKLIQKCGYEYVEDYTMFFDGLGQEKRCHSYRK